MEHNKNRETFQKVIAEGFNLGNYQALDVLFTPTYKEHQFGLQGTLEGFKNDIRSLRDAFPDFHLTIEDMAENGDLLWVRMKARGTNLGTFFGPPTGKAIEVTVIDVCRFENGQIAEHWGVPDRFAVLAQLGLLRKAETSPA